MALLDHNSKLFARNLMKKRKLDFPIFTALSMMMWEIEFKLPLLEYDIELIKN